jgi:KRAB domain-containing zinc finger protein
VFNKDVLRSYNRTCPFCSKVYCNDVSLRAHLFTHSSQKQYACPSCPRRFTQNGHRSEHIRRRHSDERPYVCMYCHGSFACASHLRLHLRAHGIPLDKRRTRTTGPFRCDVCGQELANRQTLASHRRLHTGEKPIVCSVCGLTFHDPSYFWRHCQKHRPSTVNSTSKQAPTPCSKCGKIFGNAELMRVHQRVHSSRRPYVCPKCGDAFKRPGDLRLHDRTHTGHKPYECQTCGVAFTQAHSLKNHVRCHTNERPHSCSVCSKAFRTADKLRVHFRVHTGERPHVCHVCSFSFADRSALRRHVKRHVLRKETVTERTHSSTNAENTIQTVQI